MSFDKKDMLLYLVTDRTWLSCATLAEQVEASIKNGATFIQLREKDLPDAEFLASAKELCALCHKHHVPFVVNDNVDIALASGADGVHVGQDDMAACDVRKLLGEGKILGVSAQTVEQAKAAEAAGADYLGVGAVFGTTTKLDACEVPFETLRAICAAVKIPVVAIGGISKYNVAALSGSGIAGISVISAILASGDIAAATRDLRARVSSVVNA